MINEDPSGTVEHCRRRETADPELTNRAYWELRHGRLRLALAENELAWAHAALIAGYINTDTALEVLDQVMDQIAGVP